MNTMMQDAPIHERQASPVASNHNPDSNSPRQADEKTRAKPSAMGLDRQQILSATRICLDAQGYDATTIRRIAAQLDCAIGSIYRYYRDKHELLSCVTGQPFEQLAEEIEQGQSFTQSLQTYVTLATQSIQSYSLMFWLANQKGTGLDDAPARNELPAVIERIITAWAYELGDVQKARVAWAAMHGSIMAGMDPARVIHALGLTATDAKAHDQTSLQIMTVMRRPPLPRAMRESQTSQVTESTLRSSAPAAGEESSSPQQAKEDVCLL